MMRRVVQRTGVRAYALLLALALAGALLAAPAQARKNVLLLFDEDNDLPGLAVINRSVRETFRARLGDEVEFYSESLQLSQFDQPGHDLRLRDHFRRKYQGRQLDLIVAVMEPSLDFLVRHGEAAFGSVPVVFCGLDPSDINRKMLRENMTGVLVQRTFAPTLDIALELQPDARRLYMVGGTSRFDRQIQAIARRELQPYEERLRITWLTSLPVEQLLKTVSTLPPDSIIYFLTVFTDGAGKAFTPHGVLTQITAVANAPVYVAVDQYVGLGSVGGHVYSVEAHGEQAATIGLRVLSGEKPLAIPVIAQTAQKNIFDWRQLRRWQLDEKQLPPGSVLEYRARSLWDVYRWYILAGVVLFLLQSALVLGLLVNRARRRRAEMEAARQRGELAHALRVTTLGEMTASFAHEISQPLTAITANAEAARALLARDRENPEIAEALADMAADARRATETILRLRALFRKEATALAPLDMNALVDDVLRLLAGNLRSRHIAIDFARADGLPQVLGDPIQLRQVIINLLVNAEEAIAVAGNGPREIHVQTRRLDERRVGITVRDTGTGYAGGDLEQMFEHFATTKPRGLGMGLAICRSIVEAHGGIVWAERNPDRGLTLHVDLPVHPGVAKPVRRRDQPNPQRS